MRQGPSCCEKAENKNEKRTHTVVSMAVTVTITHASPPHWSQWEAPKKGNLSLGKRVTHSISRSPWRNLAILKSAKHWLLWSLWIPNNNEEKLTAQLLSPSSWESQSTKANCQRLHWHLNESREAWTREQ